MTLFLKVQSIIKPSSIYGPTNFVFPSPVVYRSNQELREELANFRIDNNHSLIDRIKRKKFLGKKEAYSIFSGIVSDEEIKRVWLSGGEKSWLSGERRNLFCEKCDQLNIPQHWCKPLNVEYFRVNFDK